MRYFLHKGLYVFSVFALSILGFDVFATTANQAIQVTTYSDNRICFEDRLDFNLEISLKNNTLDTVQNVALTFLCPELSISNFNVNQSLLPGDTALVALNHLNIMAAGVHVVQIVTNRGGGESNDTSEVEVIILPSLQTNSLKDSTVCYNETTVFRAETGFSSYLWSNGTIGQSNTVNVAGMHNVTVTDSLGCRAVDSFNVFFHAMPSALAPGDTTICKGEVLNANINPTFQGVQWSNGDYGNMAQINDSGLFVVQASDVHGCSHVDSFTVSYFAVPNPGIVGNLNICEGDTVQLSTNSGYHSYGWSNGDTSSSIIVTTTGVYTVSVLGPNGCVGYDTASVYVSPLPMVNFSDSSMCNNVPLLVDVGAYASYSWSTGDTTSFSMITAPGWYKVTVEDYSGCQGEDSVYVHNTNVSVSLGNDTIICQGAALFAQLNPIYDEILWNNGETAAYHFIGNSGTHKVTVRIGNCTATDEIKVTEDPVPFSDFTISVSSPGIFTNNLSNTTNCTWFFGDGNSATIFEPQHTYANHGVYDVMLISETACGQDTMIQQVGIYPQNIGNVGAANYTKVYPTLASTELFFEIYDRTFSTVRYRIIDVAGKELMNKQNGFSNDRIGVNISSLAMGQYFISIFIDEDEVPYTVPFIKE